MSVGPGTVIGPYQILERLGQGGMATVYKALQPALARHVAIKILPVMFADDATFRERFQHEARAIAQLRHPSILVAFDYGEHEGLPYLVSEFIDGGTLAGRVGTPLAVDEVARLLAPVAGALDYAHSRGVLHRDVKPANILLTSEGAPILSDFGLVKLMDSASHLTRTGTVVGTPEYMAPEQGAGETLGPAVDNYALAVVAYELLTGHVPFRAETPLAVILAHMYVPPPSPSAANPELSPAVEEILLKGLAKAPENRYATATELIAALSKAGDRIAAAAAIARDPARPGPAGHLADPAPGARASPPAGPPASVPAPGVDTGSAAPSPRADQPRPRPPMQLLIGAVAAALLILGGIALTGHLGSRGAVAPATSTPSATTAATASATAAVTPSATAVAVPSATTAAPPPVKAVGTSPVKVAGTPPVRATRSPAVRPGPPTAVTPLSPAARAALPTGPQGPDTPNRLYFKGTYHTLAGPFLRFWRTHLGGIVLGAPITEPFAQGGHQLQYLQRGALRLADGEVHLVPLGLRLTAGRGFGPGPFGVAQAFAPYYANHQGPSLFGKPISGPHQEQNGDGSGHSYLVQWFENGRLELHPELPPRSRVLPGMVGKEALVRAEQAHG